jgi:hypothetical protein
MSTTQARMIKRMKLGYLFDYYVGLGFAPRAALQFAKSDKVMAAYTLMAKAA